MKILSFNVRVWTRDTKSEDGGRYWKNRMKKMRDMINDLHPDIICFQELMFPANCYVPKDYKRVNISINHPIYVHKSIPTKNHKFKIHLDAVTVYNTVRIIDVHSHWNQDIIKKNCEQIKEDFRHSGNNFCIVCGDFNNTPDTIYLDGFKRIPFEEEKDTFINWNRPEESHGIIDHFYVFGFDGTAKVITEYGKISDHYPILFDAKIF